MPVQPLMEENNSAFAIKVEHYHYATKKREEATEFYHIENEAKRRSKVDKRNQNPNETYKYNAKACIKEINKRLKKDKIAMMYNGEGSRVAKYVSLQNLQSGILD